MDHNTNDKRLKCTRLIREHCERTSIGLSRYICTPQGRGFTCTVTVGDKTYTGRRKKSKKAAEQEVAWKVCGELSLQHIDEELKDMRKARNTSAIHAIHKDPSWISVEKLEDLYKCLSDDDRAGYFKMFLAIKAHYDKKEIPAYSVKNATGNINNKGFMGTVTYDGVEYKSLGVMLTRKQAKQSAAEVCLRTLGALPNVEKVEYTIQPYKGGHIPPVTLIRDIRDGPSIVRSDIRRYKFNLLNVFASILNIQRPTYKIKESKGGYGLRKYGAVVIFEGKFFESETTSLLPNDAKELAADKALRHLGFTDIPKADHVHNHILIERMSRASSIPVSRSCPNKRLNWVSHSVDSVNKMTGERMTYKDHGLGIITYKNLGSKTSEELFAEVMDVKPSIGGQKLSEITDLFICEIDSENKNMIIGNNECSFPIFCEDGKIMCNNRNSRVEVLPGHNVCGLKCTYELMYPSLKVYLKAESCDDLVYPETPLPVLSACGAVMLMYDHEANTKDVHILLTRPAQTFLRHIKSFTTYLWAQLGEVNDDHTFNVADIVQFITTWTHKEVQLLSEMTVDSIRELMSLYTSYDDQWNEIFAKEHTDLKKLKAAAEAELARRTEEGIEVVELPWALPSTRFQHRLLSTGVFIENSSLCTFRTVLHTAGLKIKLSDIEESPVIDLPMKDDSNVHRGDVCRYCIWKGLRKVSGDEEDPYYKIETVLENLDEAYRNNKRTKKTRQRSRKKRAEKRKMEEDQKSSEHATEATEEDERQGENATEPTEEDETQGENATEPAAEDEMQGENATEPAAEDEMQGENATEPAAEDEMQGEHDEPMEEESSSGRDGSSSIDEDGRKGLVHSNNECRWVPLEEAKSLCGTLMELSENPIFQEQVKALQLEAEEFMTVKTEANV